MLFVLFGLFSCQQKAKYPFPHVLIQTEIGDIELELYPDKAPKTVAAFLKLVDDGTYVNASFYRVLKNDNLPADNNSGVIQGGLIKKYPGKQNNLPRIPHESTSESKLSHLSGTLSLARNEPGSGNSEFFICIGDQPQFDATADQPGYAAFGKVFKGMKLVREIQQGANFGDALVYQIVIRNIVRLP